MNTLPQFTILQPNEGRLSIAVFSVTWKSQKLVFDLSQESFAKLLRTRSLKQTLLLSGTEPFTLLIRPIPEYRSAYHEEHHGDDQPSLRRWPVGLGCSRGSFALGLWFHAAPLEQKEKQIGTSKTFNVFSLELCKASPAHLSLRGKTWRAEVFTNLLLTLCFWEDLSTSEFFAPATEVPSTYFQQQKRHLEVHVLTLAKRMTCKQKFLPQG